MRRAFPGTRYGQPFSLEYRKNRRLNTVFLALWRLPCARDDNKLMATLTRSLPTPATTFIGRQREREHVIQLLTASASARLVTLTGAGGIGKTRLAIEVGGELERRGAFHDGIHQVELAPARGSEQVV
jgi:hypothetical protein